MNKFYLYGASGHCKVIIDIIKLNGGEICKIYDDDSSKTKFLDFNIINNFSEEDIQSNLIVTIGDNTIREKVVRKINKDCFTSIKHPSAIVDQTVTIMSGTVVMGGVVVNSSSIIGKHCIINTSSSIDHDCVIEDFVHISPNSTLCGGVTIGRGSHVGAGSVIIQGVKIGKNVTIGAGSVIINDIPDNVTVVGNPGKIIKK
ncbi:acetyltransferase [Winogradskyella haliclonae]|uniref:Acetyltransferase n=1 Tax=Winogradskyella haliclonae TaxID=2048558 RepID=A0ABQ2BV24_9FLAO|nr:acetyltransferase [Winogradskyella haliclonae]GGI56295.1 acetyltransferase [Winogradskyella haliclonae]